MKKQWVTLMICAALLFCVFVPTLAEEASDSGFYGIGSAKNVEIVPVTASGEPVEAVARDVDGREGDEVFYPGSTALRITLTGTMPGKSYLLTVSDSDGVLYADQQTAGVTASFQAAFLLPEAPAELTLSIGSDAKGFAKQEIPLFYTPLGEGGKPESPPEQEQPSDPTPEPGPEEASEPIVPPETEMKSGYADCEKGEECVMAAFADLDMSSWYHDGVHWALENGVMNGVDGESFAPDAAASRAMIVTMLWRMEGEPVVSGELSFQDVPEGNWYTEAVRWAASEHIVDGYGPDSFGPNDSVSREQLATILWRFAGHKGMDTLPTDQISLGIFLDAEQISGWAYDAMSWAVDAGLITGVGNDKLSPKTEAGRAQVATILMRYNKLS